MDAFTVGSEDQVAVMSIVQIVVEEKGPRMTRKVFIGGVDGGEAE